MAEHYGMLFVAWMFFVLIGGWLLINALIDVGAKHVRRWVADRLGRSPAVPRPAALLPRDLGGR
ncbi:MAG: hypothetical protein ACR2OO_06420 [Thermomicrobiales bacterium]